jgi:hypothetical protein
VTGFGYTIFVDHILCAGRSSGEGFMLLQPLA